MEPGIYIISEYGNGCPREAIVVEESPAVCVTHAIMFPLAAVPSSMADGRQYPYVIETCLN